MSAEGAFSVRGHTAIVTGGTVGLGLMIARGLVRAGARVYVVSRTPEACAETAAALGCEGECIGLPADLSDAADVERLVGEFEAREDRLNLLVNNAGATWGEPLESYPDRAFDKVFALNVRTPFRLVVGLLPRLRDAVAAGGPARVVNIGSVEGDRVPEWENYAYPASKAAIEMLTRQLARRLAPDQITVNLIAPGPFPSRMIAFASEDPAAWAAIESSVPLGRAGAEGDIAAAVQYLASPAAAYLTGVVLPVDGGLRIV